MDRAEERLFNDVKTYINEIERLLIDRDSIIENLENQIEKLQELNDDLNITINELKEHL